MRELCKIHSVLTYLGVLYALENIHNGSPHQSCSRNHQHDNMDSKLWLLHNPDKARPLKFIAWIWSNSFDIDQRIWLESAIEGTKACHDLARAKWSDTP